MKRFLKSSALVALAAVLPWSAKAVYTIPKFRLNQYYDSNAVLQRGVTLPICGTAAFGGTVSVTFNGLTKTATANIETAWTEEGGEGRWTVDFPAMEAGGPYTLTVTDGTKTLTARTSSSVTCGISRASPTAIIRSSGSPMTRMNG